MAQQLFDWLINIPRLFTEFFNWLQVPIYEPFINFTPLELFSTAGVTILLTIIGLHIVHLFVG